MLKHPPAGRAVVQHDTNMSLPEELEKVVRGEVSTDPALLEKNSRDASVFKMTPAVVVAPREVGDVKNLVKFVTDEKKTSFSKKSSSLSLTARAAGTDMSGGSLTESICVSITEHLNKIIEVGEEFAVCEPGV